MNDNETMTVTDQHLIEIVVALRNLEDRWLVKLKNGTLKLDYAVKMGSKLTGTQQLRLYDILEDNPTTKKYENKLLIAYAQDIPDWAVIRIVQIYIQAEKIRNAIVMLNDLMDEYEKIMIEDFEHNFMEGNLAKDENELEESLLSYEQRLTALKDKAHNKKKSAYNQTYGDSSSSSGVKSSSVKEAQSLKLLIGVGEEATPAEVKKKYRYLLKLLHPDKGGSAYLFDLVRKAYEDSE